METEKDPSQLAAERLASRQAQTSGTTAKRAWFGDETGKAWNREIKYEGETFYIFALDSAECNAFSKAVRRNASALGDAAKRQTALITPDADSDTTQAPATLNDAALDALDDEVQALLIEQESLHEGVIKKTLRAWSLDMPFDVELISQMSRADKLGLGQAIVNASLLPKEAQDFLGKPSRQR